MKYLKRISLYLIGLFIMAIGIAFSFRSNLGASPISSIPYSISNIWGIDVGFATIGFHVALVIIEFLILRSDFEARFLLQLVVGVIFGWFTDIAVFLVSFIPSLGGLLDSFVCLAISMVLVAYGIFLYIPSNIVQLAGEGVMQAVAIVSNRPFPKIKVYFDSTMVIISLIMCGLLINNWFSSVGVGTILSAILIGTILKYIVKIYVKITGSVVNLKQM